MTIREVIDEVDGIEPNAYTDQQKARWISRVDQQAMSEVFLMQPPKAVRNAADRQDYNRQLLIPAPYDGVYAFYLQAMIQYANAEYDRYQNAAALYDAEFGRFTRWFLQKYEPAKYMQSHNVVWNTSVEPGQSINEEFNYPCRCILSPLSVNQPNGVAAEVTATTDTEELLHFDGFTDSDGMMACNLMGGGVLHLSITAENTGAEPAMLEICGTLYEYDRRRCTCRE